MVGLHVPKFFPLLEAFLPAAGDVQGDHVLPADDPLLDRLHQRCHRNGRGRMDIHPFQLLENASRAAGIRILHIEHIAVRIGQRIEQAAENRDSGTVDAKEADAPPPELGVYIRENDILSQ